MTGALCNLSKIQLNKHGTEQSFSPPLSFSRVLALVWLFWSFKTFSTYCQSPAFWTLSVMMMYYHQLYSGVQLWWCTTISYTVVFSYDDVLPSVIQWCSVMMMYYHQLYSGVQLWWCTTISYTVVFILWYHLTCSFFIGSLVFVTGLVNLWALQRHIIIMLYLTLLYQ